MTNVILMTIEQVRMVRSACLSNFVRIDRELRDLGLTAGSGAAASGGVQGAEPLVGVVFR